MADDNEKLDEIGKLLADYQKQKEFRNKDNSDAELAPPKEHIDFAADNTDIKLAQSAGKEAQAVDKIMAKKKREENKNTILIILNTVKTKLFTKSSFIFLLSILLIVAVIFGIKYGVQSHKNAYLEEYKNKYGIELPEGMLTQYQDLYGENQNLAGYIKNDDISLDANVYIEGSGNPSVKLCRSDSILNNYIIKLDSNEIEAYYNNAEAYNNSSQIIEYSNLYSNLNYKVVGAFYTNTKPEDDNGYVFPYATPELMESESASNFATNLKTRFLYSTGQSLSHKDKLLIISCPTDFMEDFEFVLVCKLTESNDKSTAKNNDESRIHYPQAVYDKNNEDNPYRLAHSWYPEIVIIKDYDESGEPITQTQKLTSADYE